MFFFNGNIKIYIYEESHSKKQITNISCGINNKGFLYVITTFFLYKVFTNGLKFYTTFLQLNLHSFYCCRIDIGAHYGRPDWKLNYRKVTPHAHF